VVRAAAASAGGGCTGRLHLRAAIAPGGGGEEWGRRRPSAGALSRRILTVFSHFLRLRLTGCGYIVISPLWVHV